MSRNYNFARLAILILDDNAFYRAIVARMLRTFGFGEVHEAGSADAAIDLLRERTIDIVISDWEMEQTNGGQFVRRMRLDQDSPNRMIPIIMLTARSDRATLGEAVNSGATEFLAKPISSATLLRRLIHVIENPRDFVKVGDYFGPDRRRRSSDDYTGPEKRANPGTARRRRKDGDAAGLSAEDVRRALAPAHAAGGGQ